MSANRVAKLKSHILSDEISSKLKEKLQANTGNSDSFIVYLSISNKKDRARVFHGKGDTLQNAWTNAEKRVSEFQRKALASKRPFAALWVKADIVTAYETIPTVDLNKVVVKYRWKNFARIGISLDESFINSFIEAEVNGNKMIDYKYSQSEINKGEINYDSNLLSLTTINHYRKTYYGLPPIKEIPDNIIVFTTHCFFCGEGDEVVHELYSDNMDFGRRRVDFVDDKVINEAIVNASVYLANMIGADGKFVYGYFPIFGAEIAGYNILRHTSSLWSIINLYRTSKDDTLIPKIDSAIGYMLSYIDYPDEHTAYLVEKGESEVKLGANGVSILMLTEYMDVFKTDKFIETTRKLANGILKLQNAETGKYSHVLNFPEYTVKEEFRTVYYDGEATFALARAYTYTNDERYLEGARAAVENFIAEDYIKHRDHWVAYSMLEVTKHIKDVRYYEFALQNMEKNLKGIYHRETSFHTYLEMLMTGWQTYQNAIKEGVESDYIKNYDPTYFAQTIYHRARHMLNGYFYPEYAMYMKFPQMVVESFMVRHHSYRVRTDDIQHFIGGYYFYCVYFDEIKAFLSDEFIKGQDESEALWGI